LDSINIALPGERGITIFSSNEPLEMKLILDETDEIPVAHAPRKRKPELLLQKGSVQKKIARYISQKPIQRCLTPDKPVAVFVGQRLDVNEYYGHSWCVILYKDKNEWKIIVKDSRPTVNANIPTNVREIFRCEKL